MSAASSDEPVRQDVSAGRDAYAAVHQLNQTFNFEAPAGSAAHGPDTAAARLRVYVSCTYDDLREYREEIRAVLKDLGADDMAIATYLPEPDRTIADCLALVAASDLYLGVFAWRYGRAADDTGRSVTELEYEAACRADLARHVFLLGEQTPWPVAHVDRGPDRDRIDALRTRLREHEVCDDFGGAADLKSKIAEAVAREIRRRDRTGTAALVPALAASAWERYKSMLITNYRSLDLTALTPPERDDHLRIALREVFVEPSVREDAPDAPPPELPKKLQEKLRGPEELAADDVPAGFDRRELERAQQTFQARPAEATFDVLTRVGNSLTVLLGDPGAGKSTLARYIALTLAEDRADDRLAALRGYQPVLIELRDYTATRDRYETFPAYLAHHAESDGLGVDRDALEEYLRGEGRIFVIFDGLDELFDPREREAVTRQIVGFAAAHPGARVLVTSRHIGYRPRILHEAGFRHYIIQDLDQKQVDRFLDTWYGLAVQDRPGAVERRERLSRAIKDSPSIRELAGNPLLLTILAIIGKHQELPRERWKVYDHAASVLVQHWDVNKHLRNANIDAADIREDDKKELLRRLAYRMQTGARGLGNFIWHDELSAEIEGYLSTRFDYGPGRAAVIAEVMIEQFRERNFVLARHGSKIYGFVHRALLEFFCAGEIVARFEKTRELTEEQLVTTVFDAYWEDVAWSEVLRLIAGMLDVSVANRLVGHLLQAVRPTRSCVLDRPPLDAAVLAVQCLVEIRSIHAAAESAESAMRALIDLLRRPTRSFAEDRADRLEKMLLPAAKAIGVHWPGRELYLDWFRNHGGTTAIRPASQFAARFAAVLFADSEAVRAQLAERAVTGPDADQRAASMSGLAAVWTARPETLDVVLRVTRDPIIIVRLAALEALIEHWPTDRRTLEALHWAVRDYAEGVRRAAIAALSTHWPDDPETFPTIHAALRDCHYTVRNAAVNALATRWADREEVHTAIRTAVSRDPHWDARRVALKALVESWAGAPSSFQVALQAARKVDEDVREAALEALVGRWADRPETYDAVRDALTDANEKVRTKAVRLLARRWPGHPDTRELLVAATLDLDGSVRFVALEALAGYSHDPDDHLRFLCEAVQDPNAGVRSRAVQALAIGWNDRPETRRLIAGIVRDPDTDVRGAALTALAEHWPDHPDTGDLVREIATRDPVRQRRREAVRLLAKHWGDRPDLTALFESAVEDPEAEIRQTALETLAAPCRSPEDRRRALERALRDLDASVRGWAVEAQLSAGRPSAATTELLRATMWDPDYSVREGALNVLWADEDLPRTASDDELLTATRSSSAITREFAVFQLVARDPHDPAVWTRVGRMLEDGNHSVRRMAFDLISMWRRDEPDGRRAILEATRDPNDRIRCAALHAVAAAWPDELSRPGLVERALADSDGQIKQFGITALALHRTCDESTVAALEQAAEHSDVLVRILAAFALLEARLEDARPPSFLVQQLRAESSDTRRAAVSTLLGHWSTDAGTVRLVAESLKDPDESVRLTVLQSFATRRPGAPDTLALAEHALWDPDAGVAGFALGMLIAANRREHPATAAEAALHIRDANPAIRAAALERLLIRWQDTPECRSSLQLCLFDEYYAIHSLARDAICLHWPAREVLSIAERALRHPMPLVRYVGIEMLRTVDDIGAQNSRLDQLMRSEISWVRHQAVEALIATARNPSDVADRICELCHDRIEGVRSQVYDFFACHFPADDDTRNLLVQAGNDFSYKIRDTAVQQLVARWPDAPETRAAVARAALDPSASNRRSVESLDRAISASLRQRHEVHQALGSPEWTVRADAITELAVRWPDDPAALLAVLRAVGDREPEVRMTALRLLALRWAEDDSARDALIQAVGDPDESVRFTAIYAVSHRWFDDDLLDRIAARLSDPNVYVRTAALGTLARIRPEYLDENPNILLTAIADKNWYARRYAVEIAVLRGSVADRAMRVAAHDSIGITRLMTFSLLARDTAGLPADEAALLRLRSAGGPKRAAAEFLLVHRWADQASVLPVLRETAAGTDPAHQVRALTELAAHWPAEPDLCRLLHDNLTAPSPGAREVALTALAALFPDSIAREELLAAGRDDDVEVRDTARLAMEVVGPDERIDMDMVSEALQSEREGSLVDRFWAAHALVRLRSGDPTTVRLLTEALRTGGLWSGERAWLEWFLT